MPRRFAQAFSLAEARSGTASSCTVKDLSEGCQAVVLKAANAKACAADVKQFCADIKPGEGRVEACMKAHFADASDACKVAMANAAAGDN